MVRAVDDRYQGGGYQDWVVLAVTERLVHTEANMLWSVEDDESDSGVDQLNGVVGGYNGSSCRVIVSFLPEFEFQEQNHQFATILLTSK